MSIEMRGSARDIGVESGSSACFMPPNTESSTGELDSDDIDLLAFYDNYVTELSTKAGDDDHAPIPGNIYSYLALRKFGESSGLIQLKATTLLQVGLAMVIVVQMVAPIVIVIWCVEQLEFFKDGQIFIWQTQYHYEASMENGVSHINQNILGTIFLLLFSLNGAYVMKSEEFNLRKILDMCELFRLVAGRSKHRSQAGDGPLIERPHRKWLWLGAILNTWCLLTCSLALMLCFVTSESPKDVIFDALGLTFLYNLDDVGGDLGLLDEQWDEDLLGDVYGGLADQVASDDGDNLVQGIRKERVDHWTPNDLYTFGYYVMIFFVITLPFAFALLNIQPKANAAGRRLSSDTVTIAEMQAQLNHLSAMMAKMSTPIA